MVFGIIPECRSASLRNERSALPESPPQTGSTGLAPALTKGFHEHIEMLGEDSRSESLLALEVVIERPFRAVDGRSYVSNADVPVAETLKQRGG